MFSLILLHLCLVLVKCDKYEFDFKFSDKPPQPWVNTKSAPFIEIDPEKDTAEDAFKKMRSQMTDPLSERCYDRERENHLDMFYQIRERAFENKWTILADPSDDIDFYLEKDLEKKKRLGETLNPVWPEEFLVSEDENAMNSEDESLLHKREE